MKRLIAILLCVSLLLVPVSAYADGSGNIDNGGGGMGQGTNGNIWHGDDGVRVTVVRISDNKSVSVPVDLTNYSEKDVKYYFKKDKLRYRNGSSLQAYYDNYKCIHPTKAMPKIISDSGNANLADIKKYFCASETIKKIAQIIGTTYEKLTDGKYKLLLEPVAYFYFQGYKYAMSATEAAKYDAALSGGLRRKMVSLTHQQLPLSMFLERADMGYPAYKGSKTKAQSDTMIINELGLGIVKFSNDSSDDSGTDTATYRCNTDVVTSVILSSDSDIYPNRPATVTFHILGHSYTLTDIVIPAGESQLVWVKWHTPTTPQKVNISVSASKGHLSDDEVTASVIKLEEKTPPDPTATDKNDSFKTTDVPSKIQCLANSWSVWSAEWIPNWQWHANWKWHKHMPCGCIIQSGWGGVLWIRLGSNNADRNSDIIIMLLNTLLAYQQFKSLVTEETPQLTKAKEIEKERIANFRQRKLERSKNKTDKGKDSKQPDNEDTVGNIVDDDLIV